MEAGAQQGGCGGGGGVKRCAWECGGGGDGDAMLRPDRAGEPARLT